MLLSIRSYFFFSMAIFENPENSYWLRKGYLLLPTIITVTDYYRKSGGNHWSPGVLFDVFRVSFTVFVFAYLPGNSCSNLGLSQLNFPPLFQGGPFTTCRVMVRLSSYFGWVLSFFAISCHKAYSFYPWITTLYLGVLRWGAFWSKVVRYYNVESKQMKTGQMNIMKA